MSPQERGQLAIVIDKTSRFYSKKTDDDVISMMIDDLEDLPHAVVIKAYETYRRDPKNKFFPLPAQIREIVSPVVSPEAEAREIIERIKKAIADFGYPRGASACEFIGPVGWKIVQANGGWTRVCESEFTMNPGLLAQARNRAEDLVRYKDQLGDNVISLPAPKNTVSQIEDRKFQALVEFKEHQEKKENQLNIEIPSDKERARLIKELLTKRKGAL